MCKVLHGIPLRHPNAQCISQFRLSEPVFEPEFSEDRVIFGKESALLHLDVVVATARISENLAWILAYAQKQPPTFIEGKFFGATSFEGVIHRCIKRSPANSTRDIVGGHGLNEDGRQAYRVAFLGKVCNAFHEIRELITGGIGHNLPQEAPRAFAQAVIDVNGF